MDRVTEHALNEEESLGEAAITTLADAICRSLASWKGEQRAAIEQVADWAADSIERGGLVRLFGTGHSTLACQDAWPRIGGYVGWHAIVELPLSEFALVSGENGLLQTTFLEKVEGYGKEIVRAQAVGDPDTFIVVTNSGINPVVIDVALEMKAKGVRLVGITSVEHCSSTPSRHSSGKRLIDLVDIVIDTGLPPGDAVVEVPGFPHRVGALSTVLSATLIQMLVAETAQRLSRAGVKVEQIHSHNRADTKESPAHNSMELAVDAHARLLAQRTLANLGQGER